MRKFIFLFGQIYLDWSVSLITGFFEDNFVLWRFKIPKRILVPLLIVLAAKLVGSIFLYYSMNFASGTTFWTDPSRVFGWEQNKIFLQNFGGAARWPYMFVGWDSAWYLSIASKGYAFSSQSFTFSPGLPFFSLMTNAFLANPLVSLVVCGLASGVLWIPLFQLLAERWIGRQAALMATLLLAFSPYIFLFTTVAYSEALLLFFTLGAWLLFEKGRVGGACLLAAGAPLMRTMGILVVFPMLISALKKKDSHKLRNVLLSFVPVVSLALWFMVLSFSASGDMLAPAHTTEWGTLYTLPTLLQHISQSGLQVVPALLNQDWPATQYWLSPVAIGCALIIPLFLIDRTRKLDKGVWVYSLMGFGGVLAMGSIASTPRLVSVLFPLWLPVTASLKLNKKSIAFVASASVIFFLVALDMWRSFLSGQFIA